MTKEELRDFSLRISQASKSGLVAVTYEIIINYLNSAKAGQAEENEKEFLFNIKKAKQFMDNLISSLDLKYKLSYELLNIYLFINRCLVEAVTKKHADNLGRLIGILDKLRNSFEEVSSQDTTGPVMKGAPKVYAGLTYSKRALNEYTAG